MFTIDKRTIYVGLQAKEERAYTYIKYNNTSIKAMKHGERHVYILAGQQRGKLITTTAHWEGGGGKGLAKAATIIHF
jgi:hypothetical protein